MNILFSACQSTVGMFHNLLLFSPFSTFTINTYSLLKITVTAKNSHWKKQMWKKQKICGEPVAMCFSLQIQNIVIYSPFFVITAVKMHFSYLAYKQRKACWNVKYQKVCKFNSSQEVACLNTRCTISNKSSPSSKILFLNK